MEHINGKIAVTFAELTRSDDGDAVMSPANYKLLAHRNRITVLRPGKGLGNSAAVEWSSMPMRFRERYMEKYGDPEEEIRRSGRGLVFDDAARAYYATHTLADGTLLKEAMQREYVLNASVLNLLIRLADTQRGCRNRAGNRTPLNWKAITEESDELRRTYGHTLPASETRLRARMREYRKSGYACLISGKLSNTNTVKITDEAGEWLVAHKMSLNPVYTNAQLLEAYNAAAAVNGWKPLKSAQTMLSYLNRPEVKQLWYGVEQGSHRANNVYVHQNRTLGASCRDALWYVDGTKMNLYYKAPDPKTGRMKPSSLWVTEVMDAFGECFIGCHIYSGGESFMTTYEALRNAIETVGRMPYELVYDNQSGSKSRQAARWHEKLASICHPAMAYNARSKTIEKAFGDFQASVLHSRVNYTGGNITARSERARINEAMIISNVDALPTRDEVIRDYMAARAEWNGMPHPVFKGKSRWQVYSESVNPKAHVLDAAIREDVFFISTEKPSTFRANGIEISVGGRSYAYDVFSAPGRPDLAWDRDHVGCRFVVEYDPHDMSRVRLCSEDGYGLRFERWAEPYLYVHRAMQDQTEGERSAIIDGLKGNKELIVRNDIRARELQMKYGVGAESVGYRAPLPQGVTEREYLRYAEAMSGAGAGAAPAGGDGPELGGTIGQMEKAASGFDRIEALSRL